MYRRGLLAAGVGTLAATAGCLDVVYPRVAGTVRAKRFEGRLADDDGTDTGTGTGWRTLVAVTPDGRSVHPDVGTGGVGGAGSGPVTVPQSTTERLADGGYRDLRFRVRLALSTRDPVAGVPAGGTRTYEVDRHGFNGVTVGGDVAGRVARVGGDRLAYVEGGGAGASADGRAGG